ncbi:MULTISPECIES: outer membrane protein assembly factor BamB family protein [Paenibacillus]|jgi:outer membrane protein assembly factor BamB|uniref:PQQ-binding-like beta-propeller repeat protein n=2 Tax=Paenibacillus TaxID=44249 RepID=A0AAJ3J2H5_PAEPO|nr:MULTISPECIES: PQQ-binding-like beta-propeller repeat protein [Paenibacillus]MDH2334080.1 PQQ-binding-like beta-propeller repeat protein [Paenibacillus polymyxa]MDR6780803.1 outer membrane protein assembly factor BamB [Paenibacillus peoriae]ODA10338.1 serine/threonine protein kinase [Paenibacillus polymyxa]ODB61893.1 serine/threonine protein kinase [Paenibacillus polymyxa]OME65557.1 serine/threonine protein kinase [Paenibacillus peoriae]
MRKTIHSTLFTGLALASIGLPLISDGFTEKASAEQSAVSMSNAAYSTTIQAPVIKPSWSFPVIPIDRNRYPDQAVAIAENGKVFAVDSNHRLVALEASSGRKLWQYGDQLTPVLTYNKGIIYGMTRSGSIYAVTEAGKKVWSTPLGFTEAYGIQRIGPTIYIMQSVQTAAIDAVSGKVKWKISEDKNSYSGLGEIMETDGVLIRNYNVQGSLTFEQINAYDAKTGKKLWDSFRSSFPLAVKDGIVYSVANTFMIDDDPVNRKVTIAQYDLKTGESKGDRQYRWTEAENKDGTFQSGGIYGSAFLYGKDLYVFQGKILASYDFWNYKPDSKPARKWAQNGYDQLVPLLSIHEGRMFYQDFSTSRLTAMKLSSGQFIHYDGDNPTVQADVFGKGVYVGQSDGVFHGYDLMSLKPVFAVNTGSRSFGPTLKSGGMIFIQSGNRLLGVKLPASLK